MKGYVAVVVVALLMGAVGGAAATVGVLAYTHYGGSAYFWDCSSASPHDQDVGWATEYGIVKGYADGTYHPTAVVTREQMATYLMRQAVGDMVSSWLIVDYMYFDGYYFGQVAYDDGVITWEEHQTFADMLDWLTALIDYQADVMASSKDPGADAALALTAAQVMGVKTPPRAR